MDVGNTHCTLGVWVSDTIRHQFRLATDLGRTADEYAALLLTLFHHENIGVEKIGGVLVSSVVPSFNPTVRRLSRRLFGVGAIFVEPGIKTGMPIRYDNPTEVGADRIVNSVAAHHLYGAPVVVVDFGTATTFDVVDPSSAYAGGVIAPGLEISSEALFSHASKLSQVDLKRPDRLVGRSTVGALQSGIYYGYLGLVDGILKRLKEQWPELRTVVATGQRASLMAEGSEHITEVHETLTLRGLECIYQRNRALFHRS